MKRKLARLALLAAWLGYLPLHAGESRLYTIRLFWQSVPEALEIAPVEPFSPKSAPRLKLADGREIYLRGALRVAADGNTLVLGHMYRDYAASITSDSPLRLRAAGGTWGVLHGDLHVWAADGQLEIQIRISPEEYTRAVLAGEGGGLRQIEALKALAVCIRSYAFANGPRHQTEGFDFCDTTHCQDLRLAPGHPLVLRAVGETAAELLWNNGNPVRAYHHADSGGQTEDAQAAWGNSAPMWMNGRPDPFSTRPEPAQWSSRIDKESLFGSLREEKITLGGPPEIRIVSRTRSGRVKQIRVNGRDLPASTFRFAIGRHLGWGKLPSDLYDLRDEGNFVIFEGKGRGHGVGLSQRGAAEMAKADSTYRDILEFYFPGTRVGISAQGIPWLTLRSERLVFYFAPGAQDASFPPLAETELRRLEQETGFTVRSDVAIRVYPDLALFRNSSGLGGDIAGAVRRREIHLQPLEILRRHGIVTSTLRHELLHILLDDQAQRQLPLWFQEGMAEWLSGIHRPKNACIPYTSFQSLERSMEASMEEARLAARETAAELVFQAAREFGKSAVLGWVREGPPENDHRLTRLLQKACQGREKQ